MDETILDHLSDQQIDRIYNARAAMVGARRAGEGFGVSAALTYNKVLGKPTAWIVGNVDAQKTTFGALYGRMSPQEREIEELKAENARLRKERRRGPDTEEDEEAWELYREGRKHRVACSDDEPENTVKVRRRSSRNSAKPEEVEA